MRVLHRALVVAIIASLATLVHGGHDQPELYPPALEVPLKVVYAKGSDRFEVPVSPTHGPLAQDPELWFPIASGLSEDGTKVLIALTNYTLQVLLVHNVDDNKLVFWFVEPFGNPGTAPVSEWGGNIRWDEEAEQPI